MRKILVSVIAMMAASALLGGCATLDVVQTQGMNSLSTIMEKFPEIEVASASSDFSSLSSDGSTLLLVSRDFAKTTDGDLLISTPLQPFLDAGLDAAKLSGNFRADADRLYLAKDFGSPKTEGSTLSDLVFTAVSAERDSLSYHEALDHFGISLGDGKFEWAKDYTNNDKDIVFILSADPLTDAGVDVQNVDGWVFLVMQGEDGTSSNLLVKPVDLG